MGEHAGVARRSLAAAAIVSGVRNFLLKLGFIKEFEFACVDNGL